MLVREDVVSPAGSECVSGRGEEGRVPRHLVQGLGHHCAALGIIIISHKLKPLSLPCLVVTLDSSGESVEGKVWLGGDPRPGVLRECCEAIGGHPLGPRCPTLPGWP